MMRLQTTLLGPFQRRGGACGLTCLHGSQHPFGIVQVEFGQAQALGQGGLTQPGIDQAGGQAQMQGPAVEATGGQFGAGGVTIGHP